MIDPTHGDDLRREGLLPDRSSAGAPSTYAAYDPEGREGMVMVYDDRGQYLGCMGVATWRVLVTHPAVDAFVLEKLVEAVLAVRAEAGS